ncbi:MAG TPA: rhodanese-like domain-containing protein [Cryomorphaceae bacterium]|nr:rhodanese-like domain-containing protein [Cryomorphaceae bacterium]
MFWNRLLSSLVLLIGLASCSSESTDPYVDHSVLINTKTWTSNNESFEPFVYIDLRAPELFEQGHLPGAINLTRSDIRKRDSEFSGMAMEADSLAILLGQKGISTNDWLILYDEKGGVEASRLWWLLKVYGHEKVKILNGDFYLFAKEMEIGDRTKESRKFKFVGEGAKDWIVNYDEFEKMRANPSVKVLDCRSAAEYNGEYIKEGAYLAGHIEGAVNICYSNTVETASEGNLKVRPPEELFEVYSSFAQPGDTILVYCQSGVRSAHTLMVLREILNYQNVYNYDGSWIEWSYRNQKRPSSKLESNDNIL